MGIGPVPATQARARARAPDLEQMDVIELNEAFAAQALAVLRQLGLRTMLSTSTRTAGRSRSGIRWDVGARLATTAPGAHRARGVTRLRTMCIGVGQGIALVLERV